MTRRIAEEIITFLIILVAHLLSPILRVFISAPNWTPSRILLQDVDLLWQRSYRDRSLGRCVAPDYWLSLGNSHVDSLASNGRPNIVEEVIRSYVWAELRPPVVVSFLASFATLVLLLVLHRLFWQYPGQAPVFGQGSTVNARRLSHPLPAGDTDHSEQVQLLAESSPLPPSRRFSVQICAPETPTTRVLPPHWPLSASASVESPNPFLELPPDLIALTHVWADSESMASNQALDQSSGFLPSSGSRRVGIPKPSTSLQAAAPVAPTPTSAACGQSSAQLPVNSSRGTLNSGNVEPSTSSHESVVPPVSLPLASSSANSYVPPASDLASMQIIPFPATTTSASQPGSSSQANDLAGEPRWGMGRGQGDQATQGVPSNRRAIRIPRAQGRGSWSDSGKGKGPESGDWCRR
ncbi:hypothetical protein RhiJN_09329 [Ceratobasidium sp. AG-Ba]|nr:hypothetical protein RhiJN_09329 [Ceratobasidium sp. AG-Ba]